MTNDTYLLSRKVLYLDLKKQAGIITSGKSCLIDMRKKEMRFAVPGIVVCMVNRRCR